MYEQEQHEMVLQTDYPSGAEEWYCPTCGRRFVTQWGPAFSMTILNPGDEYARHSGSKGGLRIRSSQTAEDDEAAPTGELPLSPTASSHEAAEVEETPLTDELRPWLKWMKDAGLDGERDQAA